MTLSCKSLWSRHSYGPGIYINEVTILSAEDISGQTLPMLQNPFDIGIRLTLDIGRDFQPEMVIAGSFKRSQDTGEVTGWGSAFVVQEALSRLGFNGTLGDGNKIPAEV